MAAMLMMLAGQAGAVCYDPDHLAAFLREQGLQMQSWGMGTEDDVDHMLEHYTREDGLFAVVKTLPNGCAEVTTPSRMWERIVPQPQVGPLRQRFGPAAGL